MSAPSLFRIKTRLLFLCLMGFWPILACSEQNKSPVTWEQDSIVTAYLAANSEDRALAQSMAEQARSRSASKENTLKNNLGPFVKLWCDAAAIAPDPENLAECSHYYFKVVEQMSNPQPSAQVVRLQRAKESLAMVRAALEIAGGDPKVNGELRTRLKNDSSYFRSIVSKTID